MRFTRFLPVSTALCTFASCVLAQGLPPRVAPTDYASQGKAGSITIAADFTGHSIPTPQGTFLSEDHVVVEAAFFGPADSKVKITVEDFSLRINGKKSPSPSQPFLLVAKSLKDPEWIPPEPVEKKSKTSLGGGGGQDSGPVIPPKMPIELRHAMDQKVQKATMPEGERATPVAGLLYFQYRGKTESIRSLELVYEGAAGKVTIPLQP